MPERDATAALARGARDAERVLRDFHHPDDASTALEEYGKCHDVTLERRDVDLISKFLSVLCARDGERWRYSGDRNGASVFLRASSSKESAAHQVLGVTETRASAGEIFNFFSAADKFDAHFKVLDAMFKGGDVLSYRLYDDMSPRGEDDGAGASAKDANDDGRRRFAERGRGLGLFHRTKTAAFGELFDRLERARASKSNALVDARKMNSSNASSSSSNASAIAALPRAEPVATERSSENPLACRPGHAVLRGTFKLPSIIKDRDFVWEQITMRMPDGAVLVAAQSVESGMVNALAPVADGHVRGTILVSGYYVVPNADTGGSTVYYAVQADPRGALPMWVVNLVAPDQAQNVARLRDYLDNKS